MSYDDQLARRVRAELDQLPDVIEKKMFGGIGFLVRGNMACGVHRGKLVVRVGSQRYDEALSRPHTRLFDMTGRPMTGWVMVEPPGYAADDDLKAWIRQGVEFALSLPAR